MTHQVAVTGSARWKKACFLPRHKTQSVSGRLKAAGLGLASLVLAQAILSACGSVRESEGSKTMQLGNQDFPCVTYSPQHIAQALQGMPAGLIDEASFRVGRVDRVKNHLAGIPKDYLEVMYRARAKYNFRIAENNLNPGVGGLTWTIDGGEGEPLALDLARVQGSVDFALKHEVGHAVEGRIMMLNSGMANRLAGAFQVERLNRNLRSYARTNVGEYFAEAFANFYCSKDAQNFIAAHLPQTYQILKAGLLPPAFETAAATPQLTDVWMQLVDSNNQTFLEVSVPPTITKVALCKGTKAECAKSQAVFASFGVSPTKVQGRAILRTTNAMNIEKDMVVTVLVYDAANKAQAAKSMRFVPAGGV